MSTTTRTRFVASLRGTALLLALAALMMILTAVGGLVLQHAAA